MLLAGHQERILARRADRTAGRAEREAARLFQRRWGGGTPEDAAPITIADDRPRTLVIDERLPCASRDAGSVAILSHIRALKSLGHDVTFVAARDMDADAALRRLADAEAITARGKPHYSCVEDVLCRQAGGFDLVYLHRAAMAHRYLPLVRAHMPRARIIYGIADLHHVRLSRQGHVERRPELLSLARAAQKVEWFAAAQSDLVFTHSPVEAEVLQRQVGSNKVRVVPFAAEVRAVPRPFAERRGLAFIGSFNHAPNADAAYALVKDILPRVWAQNPTLTCRIVGHGWKPGCFADRDPRVEIVGHAETLDEVFGAIRLTVAPMRFGAGIKGKVLESFAAGLPCVMSEIAAEGLPLSGLSAELVGRDPDDLAEKILRFHDDARANAACGTQVRALAVAHFSQDAVNRALRLALEGRSTADVHPLPIAAGGG
jgi:glycosyltransferase involved in cell wall biosynthesis